MAEKTSTETEKELVKLAGKIPMAEMCERMMANWAAGCVPKGVSPTPNCSATELTATNECGEATVGGKES